MGAPADSGPLFHLRVVKADRIGPARDIPTDAAGPDAMTPPRRTIVERAPAPAEDPIGKRLERTGARRAAGDADATASLCSLSCSDHWGPYWASPDGMPESAGAPPLFRTELRVA